MLVSRAGEDVAVLETTHGQPQSGLQPPSAVAQEVTSHSPQQCAERFLTTSVQQPSEKPSHPPSSSAAIDSATPSDPSGTTVVEPAQPPEPITTEPTKTRKPRRKKAHRDRPQEPTRQRLPRAAANEEKLSQLAKSEADYHSKAKRGLVDDSEDLFVFISDAQQSASAPPARRAKRSRVRAASGDRDASMAAPAGEGEQERDAESASTSLRERSASPVALRSVADVEPVVAKSRRGKGSRRKKERKIKGVDDSARPSKRRRGKDSEADPAGTLEDVSPQHERRRKKPPVVRLETQMPEDLQRGTAKTPSPVSAPPEFAADSPQTDWDLSSPLTSCSDHSYAPPAGRKTLELPRRQTARRLQKERQIPAPVPARGTLGIPADLPEADRMVRDFATGALMELRNTVTAADEWQPDLELRDAPFDSDSDDDEDIPLSQVVSTRRRTQLDVAVVCRDAASSQTISAPPVMLNLAGTRVPRPAPPPTLPKKPLTARPVIWAKVRRAMNPRSWRVVI